jgi:SnoaL-like domain
VALHDRLAVSEDRKPPLVPNSAAEQEIVARVTAAFETGDVDQLVALLADDVMVTMPPIAGQLVGREDAGRYFGKTRILPGRSMRIVVTRANGQPALASYAADPHMGLYHSNGLAVLTLSGNHISAVTTFPRDVLTSFGLPRVLSS